HRRAPRRRRTAAGPRQRRAGSGRLRCEMRVVPRHVRREHRIHGAGRGIGTLGSDTPVRTTSSKLNYATTLFDYIRRAMPFQAPKSLTDDEVYALTAYVLNLNDILPADASLDRDSIVAVRMPNRDAFTTAHGMMRKDGKPDVASVACMKDCVSDIRLS